MQLKQKHQQLRLCFCFFQTLLGVEGVDPKTKIQSLFGQQKMVTQFLSLITQIFTSICLHYPISITKYFSHYSWTPQLLLCQTTSVLLPAYHFHLHQYFSFSHFPFPFSPVSLPKQKPKPRKMSQPPSPRQYHHHQYILFRVRIIHENKENNQKMGQTNNNERTRNGIIYM